MCVDTLGWLMFLILLIVLIVVLFGGVAATTRRAAGVEHIRTPASASCC